MMVPRKSKRAARIGKAGLLLAIVANIGPVAGARAAGSSIRLKKFASRYYTILTSLPRKEAADIGKHMDSVYTAYEQRFSAFRAKKHKRFPLYLFKTRKQYQAYLTKKGFDPKNTAGLFFILPDGTEGLAAWSEKKSRAQLFRVLQHEGFHQFAYTYIGKNLPIWVNEGLAEYFGDGILIKNTIHLGLADEDRLAYVDQSVREGVSVPFNQMLEMTGPQWFQRANGSNEGAARLYSQAWSMVHFLVHAQNERYQEAFVDYLSLLSNGQSSRGAFRTAFGTADTKPFEAQWKRYALSAEPEPLSAALSRLEFFGQGLRFLHDRSAPQPKDFAELRKQLRAIRFRLIRHRYGGQTVVTAEDPSLYSVAAEKGGRARFLLTRPVEPGVPASITVQGIHPTPTLVWTRSPDGELIDEITFK